MARKPTAPISLPGTSEPYTPAMITNLLRAMPDDRLRVAKPYDFQRWPTRKIVPGNVIRELIANEKARRK